MDGFKPEKQEPHLTDRSALNAVIRVRARSSHGLSLPSPASR